MNNYQQLLDQLRNKEVASISISKDEFLQFREQLVKDVQFKQFRGEAKQGGTIVFTFLDESRA